MDFLSCDVFLSSLFSIFIFFFSVGEGRDGRIDGVESEVNVGKRRREGREARRRQGRTGVK